MESKKVLVIGGSGFIGSNTTKALVKKGYQVAIVDSAASNDTLNIAFYNLDSKSKELEKVFEKEKPEVVYHFAFDALAYRFMDATMAKESLEGLMNILKLCKRYGVRRFIFASSGAVYGNAKNLPTRESEAKNPNSPYGQIKTLMEDCIQKEILPYVILRYATVYGPYQKSGAMTHYIKTLAKGEQAEIFGDGSKTSDYVYIDDVVKANHLVIDLDDKFENPIFNVSTGKEVTLNEVYKKIANLLKKESKPNYVQEKPGELKRYSLDYSKIRNTLSWEPEYDLDKGLIERLSKEHYL